ELTKGCRAGGLHAGVPGESSIFWCVCARKDSHTYPAITFFNLGPSTLTGQCQYLVPVGPRPESSRCLVPILLDYMVPGRGTFHKCGAFDGRGREYPACACGRQGHA